MVPVFPFPRKRTGRMFVFFLCLFGCLVLPELVAVADDGWYSSRDTSIFRVIDDLRIGLYKIVKVILILSSGFSLVMLAMAIMNGERESMRRFGMWCIGLVLGVIIISVLTKLNIASSYDSRTLGGHVDRFGDVFSVVKGIVSILLNIVCVTTVVSKIIQVMNGEKEGGHQLFRWFAVSIIGQGFISIL